MLDRFDLDKLYVFSKEKYKISNGRITLLAELLHNMIVDTEDEHMGTISVNGEEYIVFPHNCIEISPEVYSDESGNIYNEIEDKQEEQDENSITSFLDKLLALDLFDNEEEAQNLKKYIRTCFTRFLLASILITQNIVRDKFKFVPIQNYKNNSDIDRQLYTKYNLSDDEIAFIEKMIKPMD